MRSLRAFAAGTVPNALCLAQLCAGLKINLKLSDAVVAVFVRMCTGVIHLAVRIPEQRRVNALMVDPDRVGPLAADVICPHKKIAAACHIRRDHIESAVVVADRRRKNTAGGAAVHQRQLAFSRQNIAKLLPMQQVTAMPKRHARKKLKRTVDKIIVFTYTANARVRVKTRQNWVFVCHVYSSKFKRLGILLLLLFHSIIVYSLRYQNAMRIKEKPG